MKKLFIVSLLSAFCYSSFAQITNPSFEEWYFRDFQHIQRWEPVGWLVQGGTDANISQSSDVVDGLSSVKRTCDKGCEITLEYIGHESQYIEPFYHISFWVKYEGFPNAEKFEAKLYSRISYKDESNNYCSCWIDIEDRVEVKGSGWQRVTFPFDCGCYLQDTVTILLCDIRITASVYTGGAGPGTIWIDHVQVSSTPFQTPFIKPRTGDHFLSGEKDTIKWDVGVAGQKAKLFYSTDDGANYTLLEDNIPADTGIYIWNVPDTLLTAQAKVKLTDQNTDDILAESDKFLIKPYILTRLESNGEMTGYNILTDRWGFENDKEFMWPEWYYNQFDYNGIDPFTNQPYDTIQAPVFKNTKSSDFVPWEAFVSAFTTNACYFNLLSGIYSPLALANWESKKRNWFGSCFAIAGSNALAFSEKQSFLNSYSTFPAFNTALSLLSSANVIDNLSQIFAHQYGDPTFQNRMNVPIWCQITPKQVVDELKMHLGKANVTPHTISFWHNHGSGGHTVVPYRLRNDTINENIYYIDVYDNEYPDDLKASIKVNLADNGGDGSWDYSLYPGWGGSSKLKLECDSRVYLSLPILKKASRSAFIQAGDSIQIGCNPFEDIQIKNSEGKSTGFYDDQLKNEIQDCFPLISCSGSLEKPYGYYMPNGNYSITLDNFTSDLASAFFFYNNKALIYKRNDAGESQTDRLIFGNGLSIANPDEESKKAQIDLIIKEIDREKVFRLHPMPLEPDDSIRFESPDDSQMILYNYGRAKQYGAELNSFSSSGFERFVNDRITIEKNTSHRFIINWTDVEKSVLTVYVDNEIDGSYEDTLLLAMQSTGIDLTLGIDPAVYRLNIAPNPAQERVIVSYRLPEPAEVTLKIFDVMGKEIAAPLSEMQDPGDYKIPVFVSKLPAGIYIFRMNINGAPVSSRLIKL